MMFRCELIDRLGERFRTEASLNPVNYMPIELEHVEWKHIERLHIQLEPLMSSDLHLISSMGNSIYEQSNMCVLVLNQYTFC